MKTEFESCADEYDRFRPGYPAALFDHLASRFGLRSSATIVDVGAGTGRATLPLAERGYHVTAVEPSVAMRERGVALAARYGSQVRFAEGTAEETGLAPGCGDLLVCAQAFHWCDPARALPEFARVLKPGGGLAIFWNDRDRERGTVAAELEALVSRYNPEYCCGYRDQDWPQIIAASGHFTVPQRRDFRQAVTMDADSLVGLMRSFSYVRNVLDDAGRGAFEEEVREMVQGLHGAGSFELAYRTELYAADLRLV